MIILTILLLVILVLGLLVALMAVSLYISDVLERRRLEREITPLQAAIVEHIVEMNRYD